MGIGVQILLALGGFIAMVILVLGIYQFSQKERIQLLKRLEFLKPPGMRVHAEEDELAKPLMERVGKPLLGRLARMGARLMPAGKKEQLARKLTAAGNPGNLSANEFLALQGALAVVLAVGVAALLIALEWQRWKALPILPVLVFASGALGFLLPETYLKTLTRKRQESVQKDLPDVLDLLTVSVEAGLGFDGAVQKVAEKLKGILAEEFGRVLQEVQMGKPRREALKDMAARNGVDDLTSFVGAMVQADQLGVSVGNVLRLQADAIRSKRRQWAEEKAMKAPIKMLFPLVLFVFPTIFIVLLGPAVIKIMGVF